MSMAAMTGRLNVELLIIRNLNEYHLVGRTTQDDDGDGKASYSSLQLISD